MMLDFFGEEHERRPRLQHAVDRARCGPEAAMYGKARRVGDAEEYTQTV